jgi:hypothetical protein
MWLDLSRAIAFVEQRATPIELARLQYTLKGTSVASAIRAQIFADQQHDGGWAPFWADSYTALDATCYRLAQAEALGLVPMAQEAQRARDLLIARQRSDGSWDETPPADVELPPWITPGTPETSAYLTANCGFWLSQFPHTDAAVGRAAQYLKHILVADGQLPGDLHATWLAIGVWHRVQDRTSFERARTYLRDRLSALSASNLAWLLTSFYVAGIRSDDPLLREGGKRLLEAQRTDGAWPSDDGADFDTHTTLEAIRVLRALE